MKLVFAFAVFLGLATPVFHSIFLPGRVTAATSVSSTVVTLPAAIIVTQKDYRWYENENGLTPTVFLASENTATSTPAAGTVLRLRMNLTADIFSLPAGSTFNLQFSESTSSGWANVGTSTTAWIFADNAGVADGQIIVTTVLTASDAGESYSESNPTAASPNGVLSGQEGEWDWVLKNNSASTTSSWYFRMIYSSSTVLDVYERFPQLTAVAPPPSPSSSPPSGNIITGGSGVGPPFLPPGIEIKTGPKPPSPCDSLVVQRVDLSGDCRVDMIDLSILVFYYRKSGPEFTRYDFNDNGTVDIFDVSVMMFYWTG